MQTVNQRSEWLKCLANRCELEGQWADQKGPQNKKQQPQRHPKTNVGKLKDTSVKKRRHIKTALCQEVREEEKTRKTRMNVCISYDIIRISYVSPL